MGMFDYVIADFECPYCGYKIKKEYMEKEPERERAWQTKATACCLDTYRIGDELEFDKNLKINDGLIGIVHICPKCDKFVDAEIEVKNGRLSSKVKYNKNKKNLRGLFGKLKGAKINAQKMKDESRKT